MNTQATPNLNSLQEAKTYLRKNVNEGTHCPCCSQFVKLYKRPITSAMAYGLIIAYHYWKKVGGYFHMEKLLKESECPSSIRGDVSKLKYWGLIAAHPEHEGYYSITPKGIDFVNQKTKVESHVKLFNNKFYGYTGRYVDIKECLKKRFNYELLMKNKL